MYAHPNQSKGLAGLGLFPRSGIDRCVVGRSADGSSNCLTRACCLVCCTCWWSSWWIGSGQSRWRRIIVLIVGCGEINRKLGGRHRFQEDQLQVDVNGFLTAEIWTMWLYILCANEDAAPETLDGSIKNLLYSLDTAPIPKSITQCTHSHSTHTVLCHSSNSLPTITAF